MHQRARTDPSGGRGATRVPTGTQGNADLVTNSHRASMLCFLISSRVEFGVSACGSTIQCRMAGLPDPIALSKAGPKSRVRSTRSPKPPKSLARAAKSGFLKRVADILPG